MQLSSAEGALKVFYKLFLTEWSNHKEQNEFQALIW